MQPFICIGDKTSHGGTVVGGTPTASTMNKQIARVGDKVTCPKCGNNSIATGDNTMIILGQPVARQGDKTACGATLISSQSVSLCDHSSGASAGAAASGTGLSSSGENQDDDDQEVVEQSFLLLKDGTTPVDGFHYDLYSDGDMHTQRGAYSGGETAAVTGQHSLKLVTWIARDSAKRDA